MLFGNTGLDSFIIIIIISMLLISHYVQSLTDFILKPRAREGRALCP